MEKTCPEILSEILEERILKNPSYSLRAFAKDLELSPASVSSILSKNRGLSHKMAARVAQKLPFSDIEKSRFVQLAIAQYSRSKIRREKALKSLESEVSLKKIKKLNVQETLLKTWHNLALLELISGESYKKTDLKLLGQKLGLSTQIVNHLVDKMLEAEILIINQDDILEDNLGNLEIEDSPGSKILRDFHSQILEQASVALATQTSEELHSQSMIFSVNEELVPEINKEIKEFLKKINKIVTSSSGKEVLRCITIQNFQLEK